jgi:hypothetical protein
VSLSLLLMPSASSTNLVIAMLSPESVNVPKLTSPVTLPVKLPVTSPVTSPVKSPIKLALAVTLLNVTLSLVATA